MKLFLLILFSAFTFLGADSVFQEVAGQLKSNIRRTQLQNGLTLIMMKRTSSPTLALYTKFKVGSADETPEIAGTAHLLEHMLFKGTTNICTFDWKSEKKYYNLLKETGHELDNLKLEIRNLEDKTQPVSENLVQRKEVLQRRLKSIEEAQKKFAIPAEDNFIYQQHGQVGFNAYTTHDVTNYQIKLPANRLEVWARLESDRLKNPVLREYYTERDVIMEERRMRVENRGFGMLREKFLSLAFDESPYGRPVIGYPSNIPFLDIYETEEFFKNYYTPDNMVIAIVGDLDFIETEKMIQKYFGDLKPSKKKKSLTRVMEKFNKGEKRFTFPYPGGSILMLGFHKPAYPNADDLVFSIIDSILTEGAESRLYKRIVLEGKMATGISAWSSDPGERFSNLFTIFTQINSDADPIKLEAIIWDEIEKLKNGDVTEEEIQFAKNKLTANFLREVDSNASFADGLTYYELIAGSWEHMFTSYDKLNNITKEDVQKIASKYLVKDNLIVGFLDSRNSNPPQKKTTSGEKK